MKITKITYSSLANLGNYENERIELEAELQEGDDYQRVLEELKIKVHQELKNEKDYHDYCYRYNEANRKLKDICEKLQKAYDQWEEASNFLIAQGIKPSVPSFPIPQQNLIAPSVEEVTPTLDDVIF